MSCKRKPRGFFAEQIMKKLEWAKINDPGLVKYYEGLLTKEGEVNPNPMLGFSDGIKNSRRSKLVWNGTKSPRPTKPCLQCGEIIEKPLREGAQTWEQRKFCNVPCKKLHHETLHNAKVLKLNQ